MEPKAVGFLDFAIVQEGKEKREKRKDRDFGFAAAIGGKEEKSVFSLLVCTEQIKKRFIYEFVGLFDFNAVFTRFRSFFLFIFLILQVTKYVLFAEWWRIIGVVDLLKES
jgi:hypothetical protein